MSSSSDSEDENLKKFAESVDTSIFSNNLYNGQAKEAMEEPKVELKSQRYLEAEENVFQSEINVSETMQKFIGNKLSKLIDDQVEFVPMNGSMKTNDDQDVNAVRLLRGSKETIQLIEDKGFVENRSKVPIKRRKIDDDCEPEEAAKVKSSVIEPAAIKEETQSWSNNPKHKTFEYKSKKGIGYLKEPQNEFTPARNKNGWSESKIKKTKFHSPPMCNVVKR